MENIFYPMENIFYPMENIFYAVENSFYVVENSISLQEHLFGAGEIFFMVQENSFKVPEESFGVTFRTWAIPCRGNVIFSFTKRLWLYEVVEIEAQMFIRSTELSVTTNCLRSNETPPIVNVQLAVGFLVCRWVVSVACILLV